MRRSATKIRLSMTGCITGGSEALKGNQEALNDVGKALKGIGMTLEGDEEALKGIRVGAKGRRRPSIATKRCQRPTQMHKGQRNNVKVSCVCVKR